MRFAPFDPSYFCPIQSFAISFFVSIHWRYHGFEDDIEKLADVDPAAICVCGAANEIDGSFCFTVNNTSDAQSTLAPSILR